MPRATGANIARATPACQCHRAIAAGADGAVCEEINAVLAASRCGQRAAAGDRNIAAVGRDRGGKVIAHRCDTNTVILRAGGVAALACKGDAGIGSTRGYKGTGAHEDSDVDRS